MLIDTLPSLSEYKKFFDDFKSFCMFVFVLEYILRLIFCTSNKKYEHPTKGRIKFITSPLPIVDLLVILSFYITIFNIDLGFLRIIRIFKIFILLKMVRHHRSLKILVNAIVDKKEELGMTLLLAIIVLIMSSSLIFFAENNAQPKVFSSIPASMWWSVITLTTIGYGDTYPITTFGKVIGAIVAFLGIGLFALPAGIISAGLVEHMRKSDDKVGKKHYHRRRMQKCPYCKKTFRKK